MKFSPVKDADSSSFMIWLPKELHQKLRDGAAGHEETLRQYATECLRMGDAAKQAQSHA